MEPVTGEEPTDQGTSGAPATVADGSGQDDALLATLEPGKTDAAPAGDEADFLKRLEGLDPEKLPESLRRKFEAPFLSNSTKKANEFAEREKTYLTALERLAKVREPQDGTGKPSVMDEIRERARAGDADAIEQLINATVDERVEARTGPQMAELAKGNAIREAAQLMPDLPKYEAKVGEALRGDPLLLRLAGMNNFQYASRVMAGLAYQIQAQELQAELTTTKANFNKSVGEAVEAYKRKIQGLPPITSQAGKTPTATPTEDAPTLREAMEQAAKENPGMFT